MNKPIVHLRNLSKSYQGTCALKGVDLDIQAGRIVGLIGPNGAGKSTMIKAILGLTSAKGDITVFGQAPMRDRAAMLQNVCFMSDTAILPRWMKVSQVIDYVAGVHNNFNREQAQSTLGASTIKLNSKISQLSKGMVTQLHLALIMAIDAKLLVLDEPTLGLDIIQRKKFYRSLLENYFDKEKTILITTHQVEEVENILTDVVFINEGEVVLSDSIEKIAERYIEIEVPKANLEIARALHPFYEAVTLAGANLIYDIHNTAKTVEIESLGKIKVPAIADLFIAKISCQKELNS